MVKTLYVDIETSPCLVLAFQTGYQVNVNYEGIVQERKIICIGYMWAHEKRVRMLRWDSNHDDKAMLEEFIEIASEADEIVGHYICGFDLPWIRTRCLIHGLGPLPQIKTVDTKAIASKHFYFQSNKLDYISKLLGHGGKLKTDFSLWSDIVLNDCPKAMAKMLKYCAVDVLKLRAVHMDLTRWVKPRCHAGVTAGRDKWSCSHCGSEDVAHSKKRVSAAGSITHQMKCTSCGGYTTINAKSYEHYLEEKTKHA